MEIITNNSKNQGIEWLRGIAVIEIIFSHCSLFAEFFHNIGLESPFYSGVELFFLISGFLSAKYIGSEGFNGKVFLLRKFWRTYPCIVAIVACAIVLGASLYYVLPEGSGMIFIQEPKGLILDSFKVLTSTYTLFGNENTYLYGALWYMSVLMQFYLAFSIILIITKKCVNRSRVLKALIFLLGMATLLFRLSVGVGALYVYSAYLRPIYYIVCVKGDFIIYGIWLRYIYMCISKDICINRQKFLGRHGYKLSAGFILLTLIILAACGSALSSPEGNILLCGLGYPICAIFYSFAILLAMLTAKVNETKQIDGLINRVITWISSRSYSIYICNFLGLEIAWLVIFRFTPWVFYTGNYIHYGIEQILIGVPCIFIFGELMYRYIEKPCMYVGKLRTKMVREEISFAEIIRILESVLTERDIKGDKQIK